MSKNDLIFIISPFVLTGIFLVLGYNILVANTPEASIFPQRGESAVEILEDADIVPVAPTTAEPDELRGPIVGLPHNQRQLEAVLRLAQDQQANLVYINLIVNRINDGEFQLTSSQQSNQQNVMRWFKKTSAALHSQGLHTFLAFSLNSSMTIEDPQLFGSAYTLFLQDWASVANDAGVSYFGTGLTVGHPLYSEITAEDMVYILELIQSQLSSKYTGNLGLGLCCTEEIDVRFRNYSVITLIPTPEYPFEPLKQVAETLQQNYALTEIIYYDRAQRRISVDQPEYNPE